MAIWLYTLTKQEKSAGTFSLKDGNEVDAITDNFIKIIRNNSIEEEAWWGISQKYSDIEINDEVYIYGSGYGLVGYSIVLSKNDDSKRIHIKFDIEKSQKIIDAEIPYKSFDKYLIKKPARLRSVIKVDKPIETLIQDTLNVNITEKNLTPNLDVFTINIDSPILLKEVGTSQYTDGVRIEKEFHLILNPPDSPFYVERGQARKIKVLFNNKIFEAEYRYENQARKDIELQSIRFKKDLKEEFRKVFPIPEGQFSIQIGEDLNHFVFNHLVELDTIDYEDEAKGYVEGKKAYRTHKIIERNQQVIKKSKVLFIKKHNGKLYCEACGFNFTEVYGDRGKDFIEGHHKKLVSQMKEGEKTRTEDIAMLCSNCHRMIHRKPLLSVEELSELIRNKAK
ncbi:HNH endonuclease [Tepidibacter hydrothermalis]|uniref:HNH endonuclease n=1 Tax=Tepidibacter hydrothermalis TaxID=3036126 RepID=A0ABY8EE89_9FIRM|nr:HNH endonuclease [Tepidibacter hydrothermalis]WFD09028.1 HNH endonuclease [Tepidibacter hydrothermalis]